ncbi:DUF4291 family protein [Streptomyces sp. NPDC096030]|uniref:DUF4291 family protein n=1 Tax=Streptomyces sp. NPDC096030 TaxID=3155423 RepID=UPI003326A06C
MPGGAASCTWSTATSIRFSFSAADDGLGPAARAVEPGAGPHPVVLAIEITREGFEWALRNACLSHYVRGFHPDQAAWKRQLRQSPARVQWDPERDPRLAALPHRSLQLGLAGEAARRYADEWTVSVRDVTPLAHEVHALVRAGRVDEARTRMPEERPYPAGPALLGHLVA